MVQVHVLLLVRVLEKDRAVEPAVARVPTRAVAIIVAQAIVRAQVLVLVTAPTQVLVIAVALLLTVVKLINCKPFTDSIKIKKNLLEIRFYSSISVVISIFQKYKVPIYVFQIFTARLNLYAVSHIILKQTFLIERAS